MISKVLAIVLAAFVLATAGYGQTAKTQPNTTRVDYQTQIQDLSTSVQAQIRALEDQIATATPVQREELQKQIADAKRQGEIHRLEILLEWAQESGDVARATEIEKALDNWKNPPQPQQLPQIEKHATAPAGESTTNPSAK